jgi:hypothetical protein
MSLEELLQDTQKSVSDALCYALSAYERGMIALDEKRLEDAVKELKHCQMFMHLVDLFEYHRKAYQQFMKGNIPTQEIEEQVQILQTMILKN